MSNICLKKLTNIQFPNILECRFESDITVWDIYVLSLLGYQLSCSHEDECY